MNQDYPTLDSSVTETQEKRAFDFPITFEFKIGTFANDFVARDASGRTIAYVRQKMFKFKEAIVIYPNEDKSEPLYKINADRVIDFNAKYTFSDRRDQEIGSVGRKGMKSLWKANYDVFDHHKNLEFNIREENPWTKVADSLLGEIPLLGLFTGYMFHPKYVVTNAQGIPVARLSKEASFFGRKFTLDKLSDIKQNESARILLALMMMVLLERRRG
ncbi:hypothetical protein ACFSJU_12085 [Paradesertivirga mongoliensis]|uniref:Uncharacterized protein n=1 Tax=Paradesertivirga mongoliensis TaxID=2100740 RepID=A0ABW4ZN39_9SPHI|nr:hypothetical protein [Pedobacter mongoliensis]